METSEQRQALLAAQKEEYEAALRHDQEVERLEAMQTTSRQDAPPVHDASADHKEDEQHHPSAHELRQIRATYFANLVPLDPKHLVRHPSPRRLRSGRRLP